MMCLQSKPSLQPVKRNKQMRLKKLIKAAVERDASDLHIVAGIPPSIRVHGEIVFLEQDRLSPEQTRELIYEVLTVEQKKTFEAKWGRPRR